MFKYNYVTDHKMYSYSVDGVPQIEPKHFMFYTRTKERDRGIIEVVGGGVGYVESVPGKKRGKCIK